MVSVGVRVEDMFTFEVRVWVGVVVRVGVVVWVRVVAGLWLGLV